MFQSKLSRILAAFAFIAFGALTALTLHETAAQITPFPVGPYAPTTYTLNGALFGNGTGSILATAQGPANSVLTANAGAPAFSANPTLAGLTLATTPLPIASGGTASTTATGTGLAVLQTSPSLITPALGVATATSLNGNTFTTGTYTLTGVAAKTLTFNKSLTLDGTDATTMTFPATSATVARTDLVNATTGTATNDAAAAGKLGEYLSANVTLQTVTTVAGNLSSFTLTAGDWDVRATVESQVSGTNTFMKMGLASVSGTYGGNEGTDFINFPCNVAVGVCAGTMSPLRVSVAVSTVIYLVANTGVATITTNVNGHLSARRIR